LASFRVVWVRFVNQKEHKFTQYVDREILGKIPFRKRRRLKCVFKTNIRKTRSESDGSNSCRFSTVVMLGVWLLLQDTVR